jgi:succinate dehydrogenase / fumarate reductase cytochrome b subunit
VTAPVCCTQFWLRKVHSFTGFVFLGTFVGYHLRGAGSYQAPELRYLLLYAPLLFHAGYGVRVALEGQPNGIRYPWARNWMYLGQRVTALVLVPFLLLHLGAALFGAGWADAGWYRAVWYAGVVAAAFHFGNGAFGTALHWGLTVGPHSQRVFAALGTAGFLLLAGYGLRTLYGF